MLLKWLYGGSPYEGFYMYLQISVTLGRQGQGRMKNSGCWLFFTIEYELTEHLLGLVKNGLGIVYSGTMLLKCI